MSNSPFLSAAEIAALAKFDTATICNTIELFDLQPHTLGYANGDLKAVYPHLPPMVGYAQTATFRASSPRQEGMVYGSMDEQLAGFEKLSGPPVVVVEDLDSPAAAAVFGEMMVTNYQVFGAAGLVTSGAGRDIEPIRKHNFPLFQTSQIASHGYGHFVQINVPVTICGLPIKPGDLLHGDADGLAVIPAVLAPRLAKVCAEYVELESALMGEMRQGRPSREKLAKALAVFSQGMGKLKASLPRN